MPKVPGHKHALSNRAVAGGGEVSRRGVAGKLHCGDQVSGARATQNSIQPLRGDSQKNRRGKWRLVIDLSSPDGHNVNDGISKELASLTYNMSVDYVVRGLLQRGRGALLAKMDIKQAYRNIPVHPQDRLLLGMR